MFGTREAQLADLDAASSAFIEAVKGMPGEKFLSPLGGWSPRDIVAHLIGWNDLMLVSCSGLRKGVEPSYFYDAANDYRKTNAGFIEQFSSTDREELLKDMHVTLEKLAAYLKTIPESEWDLDTGVAHYRGGAATMARCVDSLTRDYRGHTQEIK